MFRRRVFAATLVVMSVAMAAPGGAATSVVNVSKRPTSQAEAAVAVSRLNPNDVVIASNRESGYGIFVAVSHDAGDTWDRTILGDDDVFGRACCDPTIAWDGFGNLFLSWLGYTRYSYPTVVSIVLSTDAGDSWTTLARLNPPRPRTRAVPDDELPAVRP